MTEAILRALFDVSTALERAGVPPISPYWRASAERFYMHPTARLLVECVGRGGDKTRTSVVEDIAEVLSGEFNIPPGEVHYFTHISENIAEAGKTLSILEKYLRILKVPFTRSGDTISLTAMPRGFKVLACRVGAVSGWRCIGWTADECAKWSNDGADPTAEVIASIRAMTVTHPTARGRMLSTPLGRSGYFHEIWSAGNTDSTLVGHAASWIANPSITEARTRELEPDPRKWSREYAAVAQQSALSAFDAVQITRAMSVHIPTDWTASESVVLIDPSARSSDSFTWCVARWRKQSGGNQSILEVIDLDGIADAAREGLTSDSVVKKVAALARRQNATIVHADQFEKFSLQSAFARQGFTYIPHSWTAPLKERATEQVRMWLRDGLIALPSNHDRLRREMLAFEERVSASGGLTFRGRSGGHDDYVMLILLAALVDIEGGLRGSPSGKPMSGQGIFEYMVAGAAMLQGGPSELVVAAEALVDLQAPAHFRGPSTLQIEGINCVLSADGRVSVPSSVVGELLQIGFRHAA